MTPRKKSKPEPKYDDPYDTFRTPRTIPFMWDVTGWMDSEGDDHSAHNGTAYDAKLKGQNSRDADAKNAA